MRMIQVDVTPEDITNGIVGNGKLCPVARGMQRAMDTIAKGRYQTVVSGSRFGIFDSESGEIYEYQAPDCVQMFVQCFDDNRIPAPIKFEFDLHSGKRSRNFEPAFLGTMPHPSSLYIHGSFDIPKNFGLTKKEIFKKTYMGVWANIPVELKPEVMVISPIEEVKEPTPSEVEAFINAYDTEKVLVSK